MKGFPLICGLTTSLLITLGSTTSAQAGLFRHDYMLGNDSNYLNRLSLYPSVGRLNLIYNDYELINNVGLCSGTLISPTLVLTAAHCLYNDKGFFLRSGFFSFGNINTSYDAVPIQSAIIKREYLSTIADKGFENASKQGFDIAVVSLLREVASPIVAQLYTSKDESNRVGTYVGFGHTGDGKDGVTSNSAGIKRAGRNRIKVINPNMLGSDFDKPSPAFAPGDYFNFPSYVLNIDDYKGVDNYVKLCKSPEFRIFHLMKCSDAEDFVLYKDSFDSNSIPFPDEYLVASGDSGGGLFIGSGSNIRLAGVISATDDGDEDGREDRYRDISYATRISSWVDWITNVESYLSSISFPNPQSYTFIPKDDTSSYVITSDTVRVTPRSDSTLMPLEPGYDELYNTILLADIVSNDQGSIFIPGAIAGTVVDTNPDPNLTEAVPEPSTMAGLVLAGISLRYFRRRQRR